MASFVLVGLGVFFDLYSASLLIFAMRDRRPRSGVVLLPLLLYGMFVAVRANMAVPLMLPLVLTLAVAHVVLQALFVFVNQWWAKQRRR